MRRFIKIAHLFIIFIAFQNNIKAENAHYLDFKYVLNKSTAGKAAQDFLKNKLSTGVKKNIKKKLLN